MSVPSRATPRSSGHQVEFSRKNGQFGTLVEIEDLASGLVLPLRNHIIRYDTHIGNILLRLHQAQRRISLSYVTIRNPSERLTKARPA